MVTVVVMPLNEGSTHQTLGIEWDTVHVVIEYQFDLEKKALIRMEISSTFPFFLSTRPKCSSIPSYQAALTDIL